MPPASMRTERVSRRDLSSGALNRTLAFMALDLTFIPRIGFSLAFAAPIVLSENCTRKRLAGKLMD